MNALKLLYPVTTDWTGLKMGLTLKWDYINRTVNISIPNYVPEALHGLQQKAPEKPQDAPQCWSRPTYGQANKYEIPEDTYPLLPPKKISLIQIIIGAFL